MSYVPRRVYLRGFSCTLSSNDIRKFFDALAPVKYAFIDCSTQLSWGYVEFWTVEDADFVRRFGRNGFRVRGQLIILYFTDDFTEEVGAAGFSSLDPFPDPNYPQEDREILRYLPDCLQFNMPERVRPMQLEHARIFYERAVGTFEAVSTPTFRLRMPQSHRRGRPSIRSRAGPRCVHRYQQSWPPWRIPRYAIDPEGRPLMNQVFQGPVPRINQRARGRIYQGPRSVRSDPMLYLQVPWMFGAIPSTDIDPRTGIIMDSVRFNTWQVPEQVPSMLGAIPRTVLYQEAMSRMGQYDQNLRSYSRQSLEQTHEVPSMLGAIPRTVLHREAMSRIGQNDQNLRSYSRQSLEQTHEVPSMLGAVPRTASNQNVNYRMAQYGQNLRSNVGQDREQESSLLGAVPRSVSDSGIRRENDEYNVGSEAVQDQGQSSQQASFPRRGEDQKKLGVRFSEERNSSENLPAKANRGRGKKYRGRSNARKDRTNFQPKSILKREKTQQEQNFQPISILKREKSQNQQSSRSDPSIPRRVEDQKEQTSEQSFQPVSILRREQSSQSITILKREVKHEEQIVKSNVGKDLKPPASLGAVPRRVVGPRIKREINVKEENATSNAGGQEEQKKQSIGYKAGQEESSMFEAIRRSLSAPEIRNTMDQVEHSVIPNFEQVRTPNFPFLMQDVDKKEKNVISRAQRDLLQGSKVLSMLRTVPRTLIDSGVRNEMNQKDGGVTSKTEQDSSQISQLLSTLERQMNQLGVREHNPQLGAVPRTVIDRGVRRRENQNDQSTTSRTVHDSEQLLSTLERQMNQLGVREHNPQLGAVPRTVIDRGVRRRENQNDQSTTSRTVHDSEHNDGVASSAGQELETSQRERSDDYIGQGSSLDFQIVSIVPSRAGQDLGAVGVIDPELEFFEQNENSVREQGIEKTLENASSSELTSGWPKPSTSHSDTESDISDESSSSDSPIISQRKSGQVIYPFGLSLQGTRPMFIQRRTGRRSMRLRNELNQGKSYGLLPMEVDVDKQRPVLKLPSVRYYPSKSANVRVNPYNFEVVSSYLEPIADDPVNSVPNLPRPLQLERMLELGEEVTFSCDGTLSPIAKISPISEVPDEDVGPNNETDKDKYKFTVGLPPLEGVTDQVRIAEYRNVSTEDTPEESIGPLEKIKKVKKVLRLVELLEEMEMGNSMENSSDEECSGGNEGGSLSTGSKRKFKKK